MKRIRIHKKPKGEYEKPVQRMCKVSVFKGAKIICQMSEADLLRQGMKSA
jgi:hypothetical protein